MTADPISGTDAPNTAQALHLSLDVRAGVLRVAGELDRSSAHLLTDAAQGLAASTHPAWAIDLGGVTFCDVEGLRVLHGVQVLARSRGCALTLQNVPRTVAALLSLLWPDRHAGLPAGGQGRRSHPLVL